jgi:hypothetical protein
MGSFFEPPAGIASGDTEHVYSTAGIFRALGLTLRAGAWPAPGVFDRQPVVVVSQDVADRFWPGQSAVGQQLLRKGKAFDVVGVVADTRFQALDRDPMGSIYASIAHLDSPSIVNVIVAFDGDPARGLDAVVAAMRTNYPEIRIRTARTMGDALGASASVQRRTFQTWLFSSFGLAGLVVAGVGVLGSIAMGDEPPYARGGRAHGARRDARRRGSPDPARTARAGAAGSGRRHGGLGVVGAVSQDVALQDDTLRRTSLAGGDRRACVCRGGGVVDPRLAGRPRRSGDGAANGGLTCAACSTFSCAA